MGTANSLPSSVNSCRKTRVGGWLALFALLAGGPVLASSTAGMVLADAAMKGDMQAVKALLKGGADPNARGQFGTAALHWRVDADDLAGTKLLLEAGANVNALT